MGLAIYYLWVDRWRSLYILLSRWCWSARWALRFPWCCISSSFKQKLWRSWHLHVFVLELHKQVLGPKKVCTTLVSVQRVQNWCTNNTSTVKTLEGNPPPRFVSMLVKFMNETVHLSEFRHIRQTAEPERTIYVWEEWLAPRTPRKW